MLQKFRAVQPSLLRSLHTSSSSLAFKKSSGSPAAQQRMQTPRKGSSEFRAFPEAAAYSRYHETAPELPADESHLTVVSADSLSSLKAGTLVSWPGDVLACLTHLGSFRPQQHNELFRTHSSLVRTVTESVLAEHLRPAHALLVTGEPGVGKSSLLTQAHAAAKLQGWAVIHISQPNVLVDGSVDALFNKASGLWDQPMFMGRLWKKTLKGNRELAKDLQAGDKCTLQSLLKAIPASTNILLTVDDINAWSSMPFAQNTNEENKRLYHGKLEVPATLLSQFTKPHTNVCVMGATSGAFKPIAMQGHAYSRVTEFDPKLADALSRASQLEVGHLNAVETKAYVEYLKHAQIATGSWEERFQVSGNGNPREILRSCVNFAF